MTFGYLFENGRFVVERKSEIFDLSCLLFFLQKLVDFQALGGFPVSAVERMEQIEVKICCFAPFKLFLPYTLKIRLLFQHPDGHFVGKVIAFTRIFAQQVSDTFFAQTTVVKVGGIKVVHSGSHGAGEEGLGFGVINFRLSLHLAGQTHSSVSQKRNRDVVYAACGNFCCKKRFFCGGCRFFCSFGKKSGNRSKKAGNKETFEKITSLHNQNPYFSRGCCSLIFSILYASVGHTERHAPQPMHSLALNFGVPFLRSVTAPAGQAFAHLPHLASS